LHLLYAMGCMEVNTPSFGCMKDECLADNLDPFCAYN